jgi:hypothetical protein
MTLEENKPERKEYVASFFNYILNEILNVPKSCIHLSLNSSHSRSSKWRLPKQRR